MTGEIDVHNDASFLVNGKIGEDCGIGAVTIKELKGLPDCGCGDCNGFVGFGCEGGDVVVRAVENGNLGRMEGEKDGACGVVVKGSGKTGFGADHQEFIENGSMERGDWIGNCSGEEADAKKRENGVLENGDCSANGHVTEIEVDLAKEKHGDEALERLSKEVEIHCADENKENGLLENGDCSDHTCGEESKVEVVEDNIRNANTAKNVEETDIADRNEPSNCNGDEDCSLSNGVVREEPLSGSLDAKLEDTMVEDQNGRVDVMKSADIQMHNAEKSDYGRDVSLNDVNAMLENLSTEEINAAKSNITAEIHDDAIPTAAEPQSDVKDSEAPSAAEIHDDAIPTAAEPQSDVKDSEAPSAAEIHDDAIPAAAEPQSDVKDSEAPSAAEIHDDAIPAAAEPQSDIKDSEAPSTAEIHNDAIPTAADLQSDVKDSEAPSADENKEYGDIVTFSYPECQVASAEKDPKLDVDNIQEDLMDVSSVAAKEEQPVHVEVEEEDYVKNEVTDSDPVETISDTRAENNSASAGKADMEAVICFGSFGQREFSGIPSEGVTKKKEDQNTAPEPEAEQSSPHAEEVNATPQTDAVAAEALVAASPKAQASEVGKKLFNLLIKIPRFEDDLLKSKISNAQLQVDEKTKSRDAVKAEMHGKKAIYKESNEKFGAAVMEEKAARDLLKSKRQDIDSVQNKINKVKNAMSLAEIDSEISEMERSIQHETLPLKEERELINKIRKLKQLRGQMSSSIGGQDELAEALNNREQTEERLKTLKQDADSLRENCLKAEAVTKATKKIYQDDSEKLHALQARFKEADEIRQDAYVRLQNLKKELYEKNKPFWKHRDDEKMAADLALKGERESLSRFCIEQVETFMEAWNKSNDFREEYLKSNARRTLRRLGTADGRSLGPNEEASSLPPIVNERPAPEKSFSSLVSPKQETVVQDVGLGSAADNNVKKDPNKKKQKPKAKNTVKAPTQLETLLAIMETDEIMEEKKPELTEERELARKAEELKKKEEAEKLLEQRRLEEKAKAKEAVERKKRNAERVEARAALKAQKEAEQKEKEREKRAKKKERKKLAGTTSSDDIPEGESHAPKETPVEGVPAEPKVREMPAPRSRPSKPSHFAKQTKITPIPAPLRNRGKRKMQTWMWVILVAVLVFVLFLAGNVWNLF